jgi:hypothetical protein
MKIVSGDYEVLESGTCISVGQEPITFHLATDLRIRFSFSNDNENKNHRMEFNPVDKTELEIRLINFNNSLGTGTNSPLAIGTLNNKKLFLSFNIYAFNDSSSKTVHYCWYIGEEVQNG